MRSIHPGYLNSELGAIPRSEAQVGLIQLDVKAG